ncbi:glycosyltransferase 14 family member [Echinococcus multilocularis]|uniref:Glycosyltransferase 14 family member n=1 Tax=Echinococcus multilocularis TaxID=6211 RepID=A0A087VWI9_ECHMU|nr:glycosyltransferase 14 family member [Echinococcus multilocularis]
MSIRYRKSSLWKTAVVLAALASFCLIVYTIKGKRGIGEELATDLDYFTTISKFTCQLVLAVHSQRTPSNP